jgi:hypothetical protein
LNMHVPAMRRAINGFLSSRITPQQHGGGAHLPGAGGHLTYPSPIYISSSLLQRGGGALGEAQTQPLHTPPSSSTHALTLRSSPIHQKPFIAAASKPRRLRGVDLVVICAFTPPCSWRLMVSVFDMVLGPVILSSSSPSQGCACTGRAMI